MSVVNFNKARKARDKAQAKAKAAENRAAFGRTKPQKTLEKLESERAGRNLDGARLDKD